MKVSTPIEIDGLRVTYGYGRKTRICAVSDLSLSITAGQVVGFIGPNGAGKSSTINVLMGFTRPTNGHASVLGFSAGSVDAREKTGYLPEVAMYYPFLSAREALQLYARLQGIDRTLRSRTVDSLLQKVGLAGREDDRLKTYSKGMLQRVGIAQAIMGDPEVHLLDEITGGLDPIARHDVREILLDLKRRGKTVFFSSHELSEVALVCDRIVLINEGRIVEEQSLTALLASIKRYVVVTNDLLIPDGLPQGVKARIEPDGRTAFTATSERAHHELLSLLAREKKFVERHYEEPGSLEDCFVERIGHKVT